MPILHLTERQFVERVRRQAARAARGERDSSRLRQGIGDDCAVLTGTRRKDLLVTSDLFLEGIHFRREWQEPASVGYKSLARCLSDIAAMGGTPRYAFLSLALPPRIEPAWVRAFLRGFFQLAQASRVALAGGDTAASRAGVLSDVLVIGETPCNQAILRRGARPGDEIWVTGMLGCAAAALAALRTAKRRPHSQANLQAFFYPQPRLRIGRYLRRQKLASAMIDLSDGLSIDLARLCQESRVGARLLEDSIPRMPEVPLRYALHGGEDLELLFTVPPARSASLPNSIHGVPLTRIGQILPGRKLLLVRGKKKLPLPIRGFQHF